MASTSEVSWPAMLSCCSAAANSEQRTANSEQRTANSEQRQRWHWRWQRRGQGRCPPPPHAVWAAAAAVPSGGGSGTATATRAHGMQGSGVPQPPPGVSSWLTALVPWMEPSRWLSVFIACDWNSLGKVTSGTTAAEQCSIIMCIYAYIYI